jgi:hypothetical protein
MSRLTKLLGLSQTTNDQLSDGAETLEKGAELAGQGIENVGTATEFLGDVADKLDSASAQSLGDAIDMVLPWVESTAEVVGEALPPVKAALKLFGLITKEPDPNALGLLAFSLAYQAALADAIKQIEADPNLRTRIGRPVKIREVRAVLAKQAPEKPEEFAGFRFASMLSHPLVQRADTALRKVAEAAGFPEDLQLLLLEGIHKRLAEKFRAIISDARVKEKFDPLFRLMAIGGKEFATHEAIRRHIEYQLWRFTKAPALGTEGAMSVQCPLSEIFVPLDCGVLRWGDIRREFGPGSIPVKHRSPFNEEFGGRQDMLTEFLRLIADPQFNDAIVVQGVAGSGKSAFTLKLCAALREEGLRPIRIRMHDLSLDPRMSLMEDVAQALVQNSGDDDFDRDNGSRPAAAEIDLSHVLEESVPFRQATIAPHVFIFDGWDEISISSSEGFRIRIEKTLDAIRRQMLSSRTHRVRVVLTGRPSEDVNEAKFLQRDTPVLTVRPFTKPQLQGFAETLTKQRLTSVAEDERLLPSMQERIDALLRQFDEDVDAGGNRQSILGLPLLALLAIWLVLNDQNPPEDVLVERTSLYRRLVDLTCRHGGNVVPLGEAAPRITGDTLRDLLRRTAAAMTLRGTEPISYAELELRLEAGGVADLDLAVKKSLSENQLAKLMLSFFFNTGNRDLGCEFIHKSFREYLFAEAIVEELKKLANFKEELLPRAPYWKEFDEGDPRRGAIEQLGLLLGPQWLTKDVVRHLNWLIPWEIRRAVAADDSWERLDETRPIDLSGWEAVRDDLVSLWDWWAEGVHLRLQPSRPRGKSAISFDPPYAFRLAEQIAPPDLPRNQLPEPVRVTTIAAHLGDALFRLNCLVHFEINKATGWLDRERGGPGSLPNMLWEGASTSDETGHRYQTRITQGDRTWWAFAPATPDGKNFYMDYYVSRINAAGWYPESRFPIHLNLLGADLFGCSFSNTIFIGNTMNYSRLSKSRFLVCNFTACDLHYTKSNYVSFNLCGFEYTELNGTDCSKWRVQTKYCFQPQINAGARSIHRHAFDRCEIRASN